MGLTRRGRVYEQVCSKKWQNGAGWSTELDKNESICPEIRPGPVGSVLHKEVRFPSTLVCDICNHGVDTTPCEGY